MNGRLDRFDQMLVQTVKYINFIMLMGGGGGGGGGGQLCNVMV